MKRGTNPRSLANLKPMKPGQTLNPGGRPKRTPLTDALRKLCDGKTKHKSLKLHSNDTVEMAAAKRLMREASAAKTRDPVKAFKEACDRMEGCVKQKIEHGGPGSGPIPLAMTTADGIQNLIRAVKEAEQQDE